MTDPRVTALLDADPELGRLVPPGQLDAARRALAVRQHAVEPGRWEGERLRDADPEHIGLLVLDGLMTRELVLADNVSGELLGPGDVVRPWHADGPERLIPYDIRWSVLEPTRLAILDRRFAAALARFPEVNAMLIDRIAERSQRLALMQAISQLNGVDRRLLTLFWHLAERWGRVTAAGVVVPVAVPHRVVAQLVGARRPTVSTALSQLAAKGELVRRQDGSWLLTGTPVGIPTESAARIIRRRRGRPENAAPPRAGASPPAEQLPRGGRIGELHAELATLRADNERFREEFAALRGEAAQLSDRLAAERRRTQKHGHR